MLQDSFAERLAQRRDELTQTERRVAEHLLTAGPEAVLESAAQLAERLGISDATVVRTARSLGYTGLAELRQALASRSAEPSLDERLRRTLAGADGRATMLATTVANHVADLDGLTRRVSSGLFDGAVQVLASSSRIVWCGTGPSAAIAEYAALLSQRLGHHSHQISHTGTSFADELLSLSKGDALAVFAYGRIHRHVAVLLDRAEELGVPVVLITDTQTRNLAGRVHTTLACGRGAPGLFASHGVTLVLVEALVLALAATNPRRAERALLQLNDLRAAIAGRRLDVDPA